MKIIGISVRTSNQNGQAAMDIPALWQRFFQEGVKERIPNLSSNEIYCIYTHYEGDYTQPYTTILGCEVSSFEDIPEDFTTLEINMGNHTKIVAKGNINDGLVFKEWQKIWSSDLDRAYVADYEVYGQKAQNPENAEVEIYVGLR